MPSSCKADVACCRQVSCRLGAEPRRQARPLPLEAISSEGEGA
jgi:hypothetical protein